MPDGAAGIGRFAPSPTGALHAGSLIAALASCCDARQRGCRWHLRIDDIDPPRAQPGAAEQIPASLHRFGFHWDDAVICQSHRVARYRQALHRLNARGLLYPCRCTRRSLRGASIYPGHCRPPALTPDDADVARLIDGDGMADATLRIRLQGHVAFDDAVFGHQSIDLTTHTGDVLVKRRDGLFAYHLVCAVDDSFPMTRVVRGADLLDSTPAHIGIMQCMEDRVPDYAHVPVAIDSSGDKLSKHSQAAAIDGLPILTTLLQAWNFLGQAALAATSVADFWACAPAAFRLDSVPRTTRLRLL